jgi:hypothetical protein
MIHMKLTNEEYASLELCHGISMLDGVGACRADSQG